MMGYLVVDRNGEPLHNDPFPTERKAYEAKEVYEDHVESQPRPFKVVLAEQVPPPREHTAYCQCEECVCPF